MKKLSLIIPVLICLSIPKKLFAEYGCLVPGYPELLIYQSNPPRGVFSNNPNMMPDVNCQWTLDLTQPYLGCVGHGRSGTKGTYYQQSPIDDYVPLILIFTAGLAFLQIRKWQVIIQDEDLNYYRSL